MFVVPAAGPPEVPDPVPIVSPVVPLFMGPLLIPEPGLGRSLWVDPMMVGFAVAGETAASPGAVVAPVLVFCADASEVVSASADTAAINRFFISIFLIPLMWVVANGG